MEPLIHLVLLMLVVVFILRQSFGNIIANIIIASLAGLSMIAVQPLLLNISRNDLLTALHDYEILTNMSLLICIEMGIYMFWCFLGFTNPKSKVAAMLKWFPGAVILPALWYIQALVIFNSPGISFQLISYVSAVVTFALIAFGPYLLRLLLPEAELRMELLFISSLIALFIASVAPVQGIPLFSNPHNPEWLSLLALATISIILAFIGYLFKRLNIKPFSRVLNKFILAKRA